MELNRKHQRHIREKLGTRGIFFCVSPVMVFYLLRGFPTPFLYRSLRPPEVILFFIKYPPLAILRGILATFSSNRIVELPLVTPRFRMSL